VRYQLPHLPWQQSSAFWSCAIDRVARLTTGHQNFLYRETYRAALLLGLWGTFLSLVGCSVIGTLFGICDTVGGGLTIGFKFFAGMSLWGTLLLFLLLICGLCDLDYKSTTVELFLVEEVCGLGGSFGSVEGNEAIACRASSTVDELHGETIVTSAKPFGPKTEDQEASDVHVISHGTKKCPETFFVSGVRKVASEDLGSALDSVKMYDTAVEAIGSYLMARLLVTRRGDGASVSRSSGSLSGISHNDELESFQAEREQER
jgi:hypothetical protein